MMRTYNTEFSFPVTARTGQIIVQLANGDTRVQNCITNWLSPAWRVNGDGSLTKIA